MPQLVNGSREQILHRVRDALTKPAPPPRVGAPRPIFEPVDNSLERFQKECAITLTECTVTQGTESSREAITSILDSLPPGDLYIHDAPQLRNLIEGCTVNRSIRWSSQGPPLESTQVSLTLAEALVALTGSIVTSSGCGGRGASVVPDCHIVFATIDQLVPDLEAAMALIQQRGLPSRNSYVGLITGSSRTADIEKILVLGAHGPRKLTIFCF